MHESVVALQQIIQDHRTTAQAIADQLKQAKQHGTAAINERYLRERLSSLTKMTDQDELLIRDYQEALAEGDDIAAAVHLVRIQYAAATAIETKNATTWLDT